jgi:AraC-like DNA-binding protein
MTLDATVLALRAKLRSWLVRGSTVQANSIHKVIDAARVARIDTASLLARVGLDSDMLAVPDARVPFAALVALYEEAAREARDPLFGLRVGASTNPGMFDVLGHATLSCATLRDAFVTISRYMRVLVDGGQVTMTEDGALARARYVITDPDVGPHRHEVEATLGIMLRFLDSTLGEQFSPVHASFVHARPADVAEGAHAAVFRSPVLFGQAANELAFERRWLDHAMPRADATLAAILERHIVEMLARLPRRSDLVANTRARLAELLERGEPPIERVGRALGVSARTLQRRLREQGTSYAQILDEVRKELALRYLADPDRTTADAAFLLGYAELSTFHRAFRRWTGTAPGEWRRARIAR